MASSVKYWSVSRIGGMFGELAIMTISLEGENHATLLPVAWHYGKTWCLKDTSEPETYREFELDIEQHEIVKLLAAGNLVHWSTRASHNPELKGRTVADLRFEAKVFSGVPVESIEGERWVIEPEKGYKKEVVLPSEKNLKAIEAAKTPRKQRVGQE